jgi:glycosyltransferase involved in cell wall biosynthesis
LTAEGRNPAGANRVPSLMDPLVTIVITSYNYGAHVGDAIRSALSQTYRNVEVLVLDNASTDDSLQTIRAFDDPRLRVVSRTENIGLQRNHNEGFRLARGEYVVFLSADDLMLPTLVEDMLAYRFAHPDIDIAYASAAIMDRDGKITGYFEHPSFGGAGEFRLRNEFACLLTRDSCMYLPTMLFPKAVFDEVGPFSEKLNVLLDYEYSIRLAGTGKKFGFFSKPLALIRFHGENRSGIKNFVGTGNQLREFCAILEEYTQPKYHALVAGYAAELLNMVNVKVNEIVSTFPQAFEEQKPELEPLVLAAVQSIGTVPAIGEDVLRGQGLISVVVPFTGRLGPLGRALASLAEQEYERWEAIVVSDGAIDPQALIVSMGLQDRVRITVARRPARGPAAIRNLGLFGVNGEIVAYLDEDNRFLPGYLQALAVAFADPETRVTAGRSRTAVVATNGDVLAASELASGTLPDGTVSLVSNRLPLNAVAHRRSCLSGSGYFHAGLTIFEDWEFLIRMNRAFAIKDLGVPACESRIEVSLRGHQVFGRRTSAEWTEFLGRLQDVYTAYPPRTDFERLSREAYAAGLQAVIQRGVNGAGDAAEVVAFADAIAGPRVADGVVAK